MGGSYKEEVNANVPPPTPHPSPRKSFLKGFLFIGFLAIVVSYYIGKSLSSPSEILLPARANTDNWKTMNKEDLRVHSVSYKIGETGVAIEFDLEFQYAGLIEGLYFALVSNILEGQGEDQALSYPARYTVAGGYHDHHKLFFPTKEGTILKGITILALDSTDTIRVNSTVSFLTSDYVFRLEHKLQKFSTDMKIVVAGAQGVGKSSLINALLHLFVGSDRVTMFAKSEDIKVGAATTKTVTTFGPSWADKFGDDRLKKIVDSKIIFVDPPGQTTQEHFNQQFWYRLFLGLHPQDWDPSHNITLDPSTFDNKTASAVLLCVSTHSIRSDGQLGQVAKDVEAAASTAGIPVFVALTMGNKPGDTLEVSKNHISKNVIPALKDTAPNPMIFWTYSDANADSEIDFHNLSELIKLVTQIVPRK